MIAISDGEFRAVTRALGKPEMADDPRFKTVADRMQNAKPMTDLFAAVIEQLATAEVTARLEAEDVPHARVLKREDVLTNEQVIANGIVTAYDDPRAGRMRLARSPAVFDREARPHPPPRAETRRTHGRSPARIGPRRCDIAALRAKGAVSSASPAAALRSR